MTESAIGRRSAWKTLMEWPEEDGRYLFYHGVKDRYAVATFVGGRFSFEGCESFCYNDPAHVMWARIPAQYETDAFRDGLDDEYHRRLQMAKERSGYAEFERAIQQGQYDEADMLMHKHSLHAVHHRDAPAYTAWRNRMGRRALAAWDRMEPQK